MDKIEQIPKYLYHYTSLDSLISILRSKRIRFNSLLYMDDMEEAVTKDLDHIGKYCYVSAWTDNYEESIALWGLYTKNMSGVRIKMKSYPFKQSIVNMNYYSSSDIVTYYPKEIYASNKLYFIPTIEFLRKVQYTEDSQLITPTFSSSITLKPCNRFDMKANFNDIGLYKRSCWQFQEEYRYTMFVLPHEFDGTLNIDVTPTENGLPFQYFDLPITEAGILSLEVLTGPKMNENDKLIIKAVRDKLGYSFPIRESQLKIH